MDSVVLCFVPSDLRSDGSCMRKLRGRTGLRSNCAAVRVNEGELAAECEIRTSIAHKQSTLKEFCNENSDNSADVGIERRSRYAQAVLDLLAQVSRMVCPRREKRGPGAVL